MVQVQKVGGCKGVNDVHSLEWQLDNIVIGGLELYINIPKYGREMARKVAPEDKAKGFDERHDNEANRRRQPQQTMNPVSYAAVVERNNRNLGQMWTPHNQHYSREGSHSSVHLDIPMDEKKWFSNAWVGRLKNLTLFDRVEDDLLWDIGAEITPKYIGDDLVLLLDLTNARAEQMIQEEITSGASLFHSLEKWSPRLRTRYRLTWVQCWGIPLLAWDTTQIQKIVTAIGDMVEVDDDVEEVRRMDRTRVLIKTPWRPAIQHTVNVQIGGEVYGVHVVEENGYSTGTCNFRRRSVWGSSEEIESDESDNETPVPEMLCALEKEDELQDKEVPVNHALQRTTSNLNAGYAI